MDVTIRDFIEYIACTFKNEYRNHSTSKYVIGAGCYHTAVFTNTTSGDITIHSVNKGTYADGTNLLTAQVKVNVQMTRMASFCAEYSVTGDDTFKFESCTK